MITASFYFQSVVIAGWSQHFPQVSKKQPTETESETTEKPEVCKTHKEIAGDETTAFACPQDGCVRVFQRHSVLEKQPVLRKMYKVFREEIFARSGQDRI